MTGLRDYQESACDAVLSDWRDGSDSALVVIPTGGGKTVIISAVCKRIFPRRVMVIAHREELIWQAAEKITRFAGLKCDVEMGEHKTQNDSFLLGRAQVIVSTIQTQMAGGDGMGRKGKFDPTQFGALVIDEAHHATADSYRKLIAYYRSNPDLKVVGFTATPDRTDEAAMGQVFDTVAFDYEMLDAIHDGWLVFPNQQFVSCADLDLSNIRTTAGDLNGAELSRILEAEKPLHQMIVPAIEIIGNRRGIVFTQSVRQAEQSAEIFNRHRPGMAAFVCGKTDKTERRQMLAAFAAGKIQVMVNCGVLTEGFDDAGVEVIVMARPTKSRALYSQMIGRACRPLPGLVDGLGGADERKAAIASSGKPNALILDFVGNSGKHKLVSTADILGGKVSEIAVSRALAKAKQSSKPTNMAELIDEEELQLQDELKNMELRRRARLVGTLSYTATEVNPFDTFGIRPIAKRDWDNGKTISEKMRGVLEKAKIPNIDKLSYGEAGQLVKEVFRRWENKLCTFKQAKWLKDKGYDSNVSFEQASATMSAWAENGWKRPDSIPQVQAAVVAGGGNESDDIPY
jgi:superfamily II DNA or RNA helicase